MDESLRAAWNERYRSTERLWIAEPDRALVELVERSRPATAVDLGAGEGRNALWLAAQGIATTAVDVSDIALERLGSLAAERGLVVERVHASIEEFASSRRRFDLVVLANMHPPSHERPQLWQAAWGLVAPGGRLFLIGHHVDGLGVAGPPDPDRLLRESDVEQVFSPEFIEELRVVSDVADHGHVAPSLVAILHRPENDV